jgi:hypothetical protein
MARLNVLLLESEPGAAAVARHELEGAGHHVRTCHDPFEPAFPCNALREGRGCPLEADPIDVALDVRRRRQSAPSALEDGVACALRHHVPLVVAGATAPAPHHEFAAEVLEDAFDVAGACERAAAAPLLRHSAVAQQALDATLERRGLPVTAEATVVRRRGVLLVSVSGADKLDRGAKTMASVRIRAALRVLDRYARGIDVAFTGATDEASTDDAITAVWVPATR